MRKFLAIAISIAGLHIVADDLNKIGGFNQYSGGPKEQPKRGPPKPIAPDIRQVGGTNYHVHILAAWHGAMGKQPLSEWREISGRVLRIVDGGVFVHWRVMQIHGRDEEEYYEQVAFIKNWPKQKNAVDEMPFHEFVMRTGTHEYTTTSHSRATVEAFDYGIPASPDGKPIESNLTKKKPSTIVTKSATIPDTFDRLLAPLKC